MKAVVVEVKDKFVAVLSDDGCISKIRNKNYTIGQEVKLGNNFKYLRFAASAAACLVLFATPVWAYLTPYSYVSLDINPSFEFSVNRFDRVLQVKAINDDVRNTADKIDVSKLKNKEIGEAVKDVITELKGQGYLNNAGEDGIVVAASSKNQIKTDKLTTTLKLAVEEEINIKSGNEKVMLAAAAPNIPLERAVADEKTEEAVKPDENKKNEIKEQSKEENKQVKEENKEKPIKENEKEEEQKSEEDNKNKSEKRDRKDKYFNVKVIEVSKEMIDKAKNNGVTPGKMELIEKLQLSAQSAGKSIESEQWLAKSVKDIMEKTKEYEKIARCEENSKKKDNETDKSEKKDDKSDKSDNKSNKDSDKKNNDGKSKSR